MSAAPRDRIETVAEDAPADWMLIFAVCLAPRRLELSAEQIVQVAIDEFKVSHGLAPEDAAAQCAQRRWLQT